ncbi:MAG: TolC family protein, partial [Bacteroidales bacterium]|nr:TolC family protein [Bacteroidales bacterium]
MKPITKHIFILFFSLLFLNSFKTQAQETDSLNLSLKQAVQKGLENNFGIRISKKDLNAAENNNSWGKAGLLPTVSVGANQTNRYDNSASQFSAGRDESYMNSLTPYLNLRMNLFSGFSVKISKENLDHLQTLSEGNLQMTLENTTADIINAYNSVLLENEKLKVTKDLMQLSKDRYNYILMKKDLGLSVTYQVLQEKNSFLTDSSNYLTQL